MATIGDVARRAGVAKATVSRVLNGTATVAEPTRHRVLAAIEELSYTPSNRARALSLGRSLTVGVIAPFFTHPSTIERLRGIVDRLRETDYDLVLFDVETPEQRDEHLLGLASDDRVDGLLLVSLAPSDLEVQRFAAEGPPIVLLDTSHPRLPAVVIDDVAGGRMATRYLIELGHTRIAFVGDRPDERFHFVSSRRRYEGYRSALTQARLEPSADYVLVGSHGRAEAHRLTDALLGLPEPPTAIFAASDVQAFGVLEAATDAGVKVPEELSVVGFDDLELSPYLGLTTVRQPLRESGRRSAELLLERLQRSPGAAETLELELELVARRTTGPPQ